MLPTFPEFKKLEFSDKAAIQAFTDKYPLHVDFNFMGLWAFDVSDKRQVSVLSGNLVIKTTDYITGLPFFSYLGDRDVSRTVDTLLATAEKEGIEPRLRLIAEDSLVDIDRSKFNVVEDRDNFDYIWDNKKFLTYEEKELRSHYKLKKRFVEDHGQYISARFLDLGDPLDIQKIKDLNEIWLKNKIAMNKGSLIDQTEEIALDRALGVGKNYSAILAIGLFHKENLIGYTIYDSVKGDYVVGLFGKADTGHRGVYSYLFGESARLLLEIGKKYVNMEQDLGLEHLRQYKKSFAPVGYTKKYIVTRK